MASAVRLLVCFCFLFVGTESARILLFLPVGGKSMKNVFYGMGNVLSERGHEVVFFNPFKPSKPVKGIKEIVPDKLATVFADKNFPNLFEMKEAGMQAGIKQFFNLFVEGPRTAIESEEFDQLLKEDFDVVIFGPFNYAFLSYAYLKKIPFAMLTPVAYMPWTTSILGNPIIPAIIPVPLISGTDQMNFFQRVQNFLAHLLLIHVITPAQRWYSDSLVAEKFGAGVIPPNIEIERNMSVLFQSSNPVIDYHHPMLPNVVDVGGLHCSTHKPLPKQLQDFIGNSEFVYFSLGSVAKPEDMPQDLRDTILKTLGSLPFKVLLKWDTTDRTGVPPNILPSKWLPQQDILGHSRCRLFISHGGFASILESIWHGTPLVTIPLSGDHQHNAAKAVRLGVAVPLDWEDLTVHTLKKAIQEALQPQVLEAVRYRRQLLQEQPISPHKMAAHWVEHMVRYNGAPHLRSIAADLYWFQYYSLDVLAFMVVVMLLVLKVMMMVMVCCCRCMCGGKKPGRDTHQKRE